MVRSDVSETAWLSQIKRLKGLEPSTFCMASRRSSQLSYSRRQAAVYQRRSGVYAAGGGSPTGTGVAARR